MIYLASAYSTPIGGESKDVRYHRALDAAAYLFSTGLHPFSPILHWHHVAIKHELPVHALHYERYNSDILRRSDAIYVLGMPGIWESVGVARELAQAHAIHLPVFELFSYGKTYETIKIEGVPLAHQNG